MKKLLRAFSRGRALTASWIRAGVRFRIDLCSRRERELAGHNHSFIGLDTAFDHGQVAILTLSRFYWAKIDPVVWLHYKNEWTALTDLDRLRWDQPRVLDHVENETNPHKLGGP